MSNEKKDEKKKPQEQILIEDGTLASFGFGNNPSEIPVKRNDK